MKASSGSGTVTSSPVRISCGGTCSALFDEGTLVLLTPRAAAGSTFTGWSGGGCSGTAPCQLRLDGDSEVTATFAQDKPSVTTGAASGVTQSSATLAGSVNANGAATTCRFEYGTTTTYASQAPCSADPGSGASAVAVSAALSGLAPGTVYHYRVVASNVGGTTNGADATFATSSSPPPPPPPPTCATNPLLCPPPPPTTSVLKLAGPASVKVKSGKASVKLACVGATTCAGKLNLTTVVKVRKGRKTKTKIMVVGSVNVSITASASKTVAIKLSRTVLKLLSKKHSLKCTLTGPDGLKHALVLKA